MLGLIVVMIAAAVGRWLLIDGRGRKARPMKIDYGVGDMIVLLEDWGIAVDEDGNRVPQKGSIYTARGFVRDLVTGKLGVRLREIVNPPRPTEPSGHLSEIAWGASNFRKARASKIDMRDMVELFQ